jgi:hypothetical protein
MSRRKFWTLEQMEVLRLEVLRPDWKIPRPE